jgi:hypothetical protein
LRGGRIVTAAWVEVKVRAEWLKRYGSPVKAPISKPLSEQIAAKA